jgi:hypothetical protein
MVASFPVYVITVSLFVFNIGSVETALSVRQLLQFYCSSVSALENNQYSMTSFPVHVEPLSHVMVLVSQVTPFHSLVLSDHLLFPAFTCSFTPSFIHRLIPYTISLWGYQSRGRWNKWAGCFPYVQKYTNTWRKFLRGYAYKATWRYSGKRTYAFDTVLMSLA